MAYSTPTDLQDLVPYEELVSLCFDGDPDDYASEEELTAAQAAAVTAKATEAIEDADGLINGYCGKVYDTPMDPVPKVIAKFSKVIAVYNLYARRQGAPEDRRIRYKEAIRFLQDVAAGKASLGEIEPTAASPGAHAPDIQSSTRVFTRDTLKGF